jgi:hypothetical protein
MNLHVRGVLLPDGVERDLFVVDGKFSLDPVADARTVLDGGWVVPGLVDVHAHLELASPAPPGTSPSRRPGPAPKRSWRRACWPCASRAVPPAPPPASGPPTLRMLAGRVLPEAMVASAS